MEKKSNVNPAPPPYSEQGAPPMRNQRAPAPGQPDAPPLEPVPPPSYQYGLPPPSKHAPIFPGSPPMTTAAVVVNQNFGMIPASCSCPNCHQNVITRTEYETGLFAWLIVGIIIIFGGWIFCLCLIPFCVDAMKDVRHVCPNCNFAIYYHKRI